MSVGDDGVAVDTYFTMLFEKGMYVLYSGF